jgi:hypothetical protein
MKIVLNKETMPDALYNMLLQHFVNEAVTQQQNITKYSKFDNWVIECEVD